MVEMLLRSPVSLQETHCIVQTSSCVVAATAAQFHCASCVAICFSPIHSSNANGKSGI